MTEKRKLFLRGASWSLLGGKRVWDRMQKCRLQKRTEIEKQYCIQIDTIYYLSLFSFALFANMKKNRNEQRSKISKTVLNEDRQRGKEEICTYPSIHNPKFCQSLCSLHCMTCRTLFSFLKLCCLTNFSFACIG